MKKLAIFSLALLLLLPIEAWASIGIGVSPSYLNLDFSYRSKYVIEFKFFNQGDEDAKFIVKLPSGLKVKCDWCGKPFLVRNRTFYDNGYVTGTMIFYPSPNGEYTITVLAEPLNKEGIVAVMPSVGVKIKVVGVSAPTTTTTLPSGHYVVYPSEGEESSSEPQPSEVSEGSETSEVDESYVPASKPPRSINESLLNETGKRQTFGPLEWLNKNIGWLSFLIGLIAFAIFYYFNYIAPPV